MGTRTPAQTVGPFFHEAMAWPEGQRMTRAEGGERVVLQGRVFDGAGAAVPDAMVEAWQADPPGSDACSPIPRAAFRFETTMPRGSHPCVEVLVFARGLLKPVLTRVYLAPVERARADPALAGVRDSPRLATLVAAPAGPGQFRWDVRLQGEGETMFFAA
jgi:protocatechuate 3,4-dioxygenase alpha subunit